MRQVLPLACLFALTACMTGPMPLPVARYVPVTPIADKVPTGVATYDGYFDGGTVRLTVVPQMRDTARYEMVFSGPGCDYRATGMAPLRAPSVTIGDPRALQITLTRAADGLTFTSPPENNPRNCSYQGELKLGRVYPSVAR